MKKKSSLPPFLCGAGLFLLITFLFGTPSTFTGTAFASAFDQLRSAAGGGSGYIPPVGNPECVSGCEDSASQAGGYSSGGGSDWINQRREERELRRQQQLQQQFRQEQQRKQEAHNLNEQGNRAYEKREWKTAVDLYKKALGKSPHDKVIQENLRHAEQEKKDQDELRKKQSAYRQRTEKLLALMPVPKPLSRTIPGRTKVPLPGFSTEQWEEYLEAQETADRLYAKRNREGVLSDADAVAFYSALRRRNELWAAAAQHPLAPAERDKLRLSLPLVVNQNLMDLSAIMQMLQQDGNSGPPPAPAGNATDRRLASADRQVSSVDAITNALVADFMTDQTTKWLETGVGEAIEESRGEKFKSRHERLLGLGRVAVKAREGGAPSAGAATADLIVSQMPEPMSARAELAVEGGRIYSNVAYRALNRFMTDALQATGSRFDPESFWKNFNDDLTASQKGVKGWIQFGE